MINEPLFFSYSAPQTVAYTGTAGTSTVLGAQTNYARLYSSTDCWVLITQAGTAATTANGFYLGLGKPEIVRVPSSAKISAIQNSAGGNLYISECDR